MYVFYLSFLRTQQKFGIKIFEIDLMIFDLLTSPQGHKFDPRVKILLVFCCACLICFISFICENTHKVGINIFEIDFVI